MVEDPIVEELRKVREEMLVEHGGLEGLVKHLGELQQQMPERVVKLDSKPAVLSHRKIS
jgi:hypothetical protein